MIRLFLDNRVWVLLFLPFIVAIYLVFSTFGYETQFGQASLTSLISPFLKGFPIAHNIAHFLMLLTNAILLNWVFNSNEFLEKNTYMVSLLYIIIMSFFHNWGEPSWLFVAHLFAILGTGILFRIKPQHNAKKQVFNASFLFGISIFFEISLIFILPVLLLLIINIRGLQIREVLLLFIGLLLPTFFLWILSMFSSYHWPVVGIPNVQIVAFSGAEIANLTVIVLLFVFSILGLRARLSKASLRLKKQAQTLTILMLYLIIIGLGAFVFYGQTALLSLLAIPFGFYFTYALLSSSLGVSSHLFFYLLFTFSVLKYIFFYRLGADYY